MQRRVERKRPFRAIDIENGATVIVQRDKVAGDTLIVEMDDCLLAKTAFAGKPRPPHRFKPVFLPTVDP